MGVREVPVQTWAIYPSQPFNRARLAAIQSRLYESARFVFFAAIPQPPKEAGGSARLVLKVIETADGPLLGERFSCADAAGHRWESSLEVASLPFLGDHRVQGAPVLPGAAQVELALSASRQVLGGGYRLQDLELLQALFLDQPRMLQVSLRPGPGGIAFSSWAFVLLGSPMMSGEPRSRPRGLRQDKRVRRRAR